MIRKKSNFLTFCFSLLPGAGQMYMGFMKRGSSLMAYFFLTIFLSSWLGLGPLMFLMPIIWFYAFFDTHNLRSTPDDEFYALEDEFILIPEFAREKAQLIQTKYRNVFAIALIVIGISILWNNFIEIIDEVVPGLVYTVLYRFGRLVPQLFVACAIIAFGIYLIRGKKKDLDSTERDNFLEDKGGKA
ncbi:MAG: hypothetical protein H6Q59_330 [Firmicutes bacterium]|nr:hypothetical protein [Bacillota bacterium]